ncbi:MAG: von Willebrand factor type A domain-containing protein [Propionibacteriaceae bacterium]|jgi:Ca-activated chloride channel family protein|nr:von Willebrand factor type A domain-containing protein [Propionibacteriaceae bacterium]
MNAKTLAAAAVAGLVALAGCAGTGGTVSFEGAAAPAASGGVMYDPNYDQAPDTSQEEYGDSPEQPFTSTATSLLSTFSADVDTASYSNMRRQLNDGIVPEADSIRIEELVNYFDYGYPIPDANSDTPFTVTTKVSPAPWAEGHQLALIGVQAGKAQASGKGNNIVFLLDVSGSMADSNKLPLLIRSFSLLIDQLGEDDVVSIVTYAGAEEVVADSVRGSEHSRLKEALDALNAGGSTAGAAGIQTAYELAAKNFIEGGNNRVILATDGDFNVGLSTTAQLTDLIERERDSGVYISVLGFGMGNLKDAMMESIADHGNGNYAYIDDLDEAKKVLVDEFDATMLVVAQDLKLQVEFNPALVKEYRLIGYDNRRLEDEDFANDAKDAGDVGAGHSVTALYELVPADGAAADQLKYSDTTATGSDDFFTVSLRYKRPGQSTSTLVESVAGADAYADAPDADFAFAAAVAEFGLLLSQSDYAEDAKLADAKALASQNVGADRDGLRAELVALMDRYAELR